MEDKLISCMIHKIVPKKSLAPFLNPKHAYNKDFHYICSIHLTESEISLIENDDMQAMKRIKDILKKEHKCEGGEYKISRNYGGCRGGLRMAHNKRMKGLKMGTRRIRVFYL